MTKQITSLGALIGQIKELKREAGAVGNKAEAKKRVEVMRLKAALILLFIDHCLKSQFLMLNPEIRSAVYNLKREAIAVRAVRLSASWNLEYTTCSLKYLEMSEFAVHLCGLTNASMVNALDSAL